MRESNVLELAAQARLSFAEPSGHNIEAAESLVHNMQPCGGNRGQFTA